MELYRGDSLPISISSKYKNGEQYIFKVGDVLKLGIKRRLSSDTYDYFIEKTIESSTTQVDFNIPPEITKELIGGEKYILEAELTFNGGVDVATLFQEILSVKEDIINE